MNEGEAVAARISALEQRLLVAVLKGDHGARLLTRREIARLKPEPAAARQRDNSHPSTRMDVRHPGLAGS